METTMVMPAPVTAMMPNSASNMGRDKVHWSQDVWDRIDKAVHDEVMRTRVGQRFLPLRPVMPRTTSVPFDSITLPTEAAPSLSVDEGATTRLNEYWVEFSLTPAQVEHETGNIMELGHSTAVTLATRAANILARAEDLVIFQGQNAIKRDSLFAGNLSVHHRGDPDDTGLLDLDPNGARSTPPLPQEQIIPVPLKDPGTPDVYGENTFREVAQGYAQLQAKGQYGPYALVLQTTPYADAYAPLPDTLILTADRLNPLMTAGFYGTGTLPFSDQQAPPPHFYGLLVSLGGNTMDLVVGLDATTAFMQQDTDGNYRFRVVQRFALRLKDITAVVRLEFQ